MAYLQTTDNNQLNWQLGASHINAGTQANQRIKDYMGEDAAMFAPMAIGSRGYKWSTNETGWLPMTHANAAQEAAIKLQLDQLRERVRARMSDKPALAEAFLSLPSDGNKYIFFKEDGGALRILITGWGFSNSRKPAPTVIVGPAKRTAPKVTAGFTVDGVLQPGRQFQVESVGGNLKTLATGPDGLYDFGQQNLDTAISVVDTQSGRRFSFVVTENAQPHLFDVTQMAPVTVMVTLEGQPQPGQEATLSYNGRTSRLTTDQNGRATQTVTYLPGQEISVTVGDETLAAPVRLTDNIFTFEHFAPPAPPVPPAPDTTAQIRTVDSMGQPVADFPLNVNINGMDIRGVSDPTGVYAIAQPQAGADVVVSSGHDGSNPCYFHVEPGQNVFDYVVQVSSPEPPPVPEPEQPKDSTWWKTMLNILLILLLVYILASIGSEYINHIL